MKIKHVHVAERYVERVLGIEVEDATPKMYNDAIEHVKQAINDPETVYHGEKNSCPIHIKGDVAIPVVRKNGEVIVPTVYHADMYLDKLEDFKAESA